MTNLRVLVSAILFVAVSVPALGSESTKPWFRTWRDNTEQYSKFARFETFNDGFVKLVTPEGKRLSIDFDRLSQWDRKIVKVAAARMAGIPYQDPTNVDSSVSRKRRAEVVRSKKIRDKNRSEYREIKNSHRRCVNGTASLRDQLAVSNTPRYSKYSSSNRSTRSSYCSVRTTRGTRTLRPLKYSSYGPNLVWVKPYCRRDGTYVRGHYRSKP